MNIYLVGGAVRDKLLDIPISERDWVVVGSTIQEMVDLGFSPVGKDFPVFLHPKSKEEYALARQEKKSGHGYTAFECISNPSISLEDDLLRRDLTINAIAENEQGDLIDPFHGLNDIHSKKLRHVSAAFSEDPLRVLRVARFHAKFYHLGFNIAEETMSLMQSMCASGELDYLKPERIWKETEKALLTQSPHVFFKTLRECGALKLLFPEVDHLFGVPQTPTHHPEIDTGIHTLLVLEQASLLSQDAIVRLAALLHDLGKAKTPIQQWPRHIGHEHAGKPLVKNLCARLRIPNDYRDLALIVCEQHLNCHRALELKPATVEKLFRSMDCYRRPERLALFLLACEADAKGRTGMENKPYPQANYLSACFEAAKKINAKELDVSQLSGEEIGVFLQEQRIQAIAGVKANFTP